MARLRLSRRPHPGFRSSFLAGPCGPHFPPVCFYRPLRPSRPLLGLLLGLLSGLRRLRPPFPKNFLRNRCAFHFFFSHPLKQKRKKRKWVPTIARSPSSCATARRPAGSTARRPCAPPRRQATRSSRRRSSGRRPCGSARRRAAERRRSARTASSACASPRQSTSATLRSSTT